MQRENLILLALVWAPLACAIAPDDDEVSIEADADPSIRPTRVDDPPAGEDGPTEEGPAEEGPAEEGPTGEDEPEPPADDAEAEAPRLRVLLTDAPLDGVESVFVTFDEVQVFACAEATCESGDWLTLVHETITLDLLTLQDGVTAELGLSALPEGQYGQIRLLLTDAAIATADEIVPLTVPSAAQTGLKLEHGFALQAGMETIITVDFDAEKSVHHAPGHGWMLKPVLSVVAETVNPIPDDPAEPADDGTPEEPEPDTDGEPIE